MLLGLTPLTACTDENSTPDDTAAPTRRCTIITRAGADEPETLPNELINSWWVVFADATGTVRKIVKNSPDMAAGVDRDEFTVELPSGTYTIYAFANIEPAELRRATGLQFAVGEKPAQDPATAVWAEMPNNPAPVSLIPMSGTATIAFRGSDTSFTIELIRMLAKVRIRITNASADDITVDTIEFGRLNKGGVPLLPDYAALEECPSILPQAASTAEELLFAPAATAAPGASTELTFYVRESSAALTHPAGRYFVTFGVTRPDGAIAEEHYAITDELLWIQRNDYIDLPIVISDLTVDWSVLFYPPIGGYPAVVESAEGDDRFLTFGTPGKFRVRPEVRRDGEPLYPGDYDFTIISTDGDTGIFTTLPAKDPLTGEITGELASSTGTAILTCALDIRNGGRTETRIRKLYFIRK